MTDKVKVGDYLRSRRGGKSRRSKTKGARLSRTIALYVTAIHKGKWSTGALIDRAVISDRLLAALGALEIAEYPNLTEKAKQSLYAFYISLDITVPQRTALGKVVRAFRILHGKRS